LFEAYEEQRQYVGTMHSVYGVHIGAPADYKRTSAVIDSGFKSKVDHT